MAWIEVSEAQENADPVRAFYRDQLTVKIREYFAQLDRVTLSWRRGRHWMPCPIALALPSSIKERETTVPEEGASKLVDRAITWAEENQARYLKFTGYGFSKRGETAQRLFELQVRPDTPDEPDEPANGKHTESNAAVAAAGVLNDALVNMGGMLDKSHSREMQTIDKVLQMADRQTANTSAVMFGLAMEREMKRDEHAHEREMEDKKQEHETTEKIVEMVGKPFGKALERFLARSFGLDDAAFNAKTFAGRLTAIVRGIGAQPDGEARLHKAKDLVGEDAWKVLEHMSKAGSDAAFVELGKKFLELLGPDPNPKFHKLLEILGQGPMHALLRLIDDAGIAV